MQNNTEAPLSVREALAGYIKASNSVDRLNRELRDVNLAAMKARGRLEAALRAADAFGGEVIVDNLVVTSDPRDGIYVRSAVAL